MNDELRKALEGNDQQTARSDDDLVTSVGRDAESSERSVKFHARAP